MSVYIEALKQMNLVDFLTEHYGLKFSASGSGYVASSPFGADRNPSFFVRQLEGRWLFKDFSSGLGGSIIDFWMKKKNCDFTTAVRGLAQVLDIG